MALRDEKLTVFSSQNHQSKSGVSDSQSEINALPPPQESVLVSEEGFSVGKSLVKLALPMSLTQVINMGSVFTCSVMLSHLGHEVLAASALIFSTQMTLFMMGMSILFSVSFLVSHACGAKKNGDVGLYAQQSWLIGFIASIPMMLILWNVGPILRAVHEPMALTYIVQKCMHGYIFGILPGCLLMGNLQVLYGTQYARIALMVTLGGVLVLIFNSYVLMFGKFGFPALGVMGFGLGVASQMTFSFICTSLILWFKPDFKKYKLFDFRIYFAKTRDLIKGFKVLKEILNLGWPMSVQICGELICTMLSTAMVGWIGVNQLAAFQIVNRYTLLLLVPIFAFSQAMGILVGSARGSKNFHRIQILGKVGLRYVAGLSALFLVIFLLFPKVLAMPYLDSTRVEFLPTLHLVTLLFSVVAFTQFFDAIRNTMTGALRGLFDTRYPMVISIFAIWCVGLPLSYFLAFLFKLGLIGIALGNLTGIFIGMLMVYYRWRLKIRQFSVSN
jgi:MATE family multidrug resistance protein